MKLKTLAEIFQEHKNPVSKIKQGTTDKPTKPSKFKNKWVVIDGINFQSQGEGYYWLGLKDRMNQGEYREIKRQVPFEFFVAGVRIGKYVADFVTLDWNGTFEVIDFKSRFTVGLQLYILKKQLMLACYGVAIKEVGVK